MPVLLGISASLRNARFGRGNDALIREIMSLEDWQSLKEWLSAQTKIRFQDFVDAGRAENQPFDQMYAKLRRLRGERGLSNSEAGIAAALWGAKQEGATIRHLSLAQHFPMNGDPKDLEGLRDAFLNADAIILSSPVYFGDRGSLAQSLIEFIAGDPELSEKCRGKVFAGIAVGAKRNGGQETALIYQMLDMVNLDFLAVGNSSETTSQYGGTTVAGDVGTAHKDDEGLETAVGTGQRAARTAALLDLSRGAQISLHGPLNVQLWLLQDDLAGSGAAFFRNWAREVSVGGSIDASVLDVTRETVTRCIACDVCPTDVGPREQYRCIIKSPDDFFAAYHDKIIEADAVLLCAYSPRDRAALTSVYQQFIERTRYLRRDNYVFTDLLMAPFVVSELSARQNLHLRMLTSTVRHHTVLHHPLIAMMHEGRLLDEDGLRKTGDSFLAQARQLTLGRYLRGLPEDVVYHPKGYEISAAKARLDRQLGRTDQTVRDNAIAHSTKAGQRVTLS